MRIANYELRITLKAILLDIEGTTTPIDFVHKTLFPFARASLFDFVSKNFAGLQNEIALLRSEHAQDFANGADLAPFDDISIESIVEYLRYLIDNDRKSTALKSIQGKIWQQGYESGELLGEIFDDVCPAFKRWQSDGKIIAIFSSGSVLAQKLIFGFSVAGDLRNYISAYFDTTTGAKTAPESYRAIAAALGFPPVEILFLSDIIAELEAAAAIGMKCQLSVRPNNPPIENYSQFKSFYSFKEI